MTTTDQPAPDTDPFLVVASLHGARLQITARSALAAVAAAQYWLSLGVDTVNWFLREDMVHPRPVLLFIQRAGDDVVHVTELVAGEPVSSHTATCCDIPLRWDVMQICAPDMAEPCLTCHTAIRSRLSCSPLWVQSSHR